MKKDGVVRAVYLYDVYGSPIGAEIDGVSYWFEKTPMGDIVSIHIDGVSTICSFYYDAWGSVTKGTLLSYPLIEEFIPFRYRGYVYDNETGLYYLNSRYYDPVTSRFVNADGYVSTGTGLMGYNMFSYCNNNPVSMVDPNGNCPNTIEHMKRVFVGLEDCDVYHNLRSVLRLKREMAAYAEANTTITESAGASVGFTKKGKFIVICSSATDEITNNENYIVVIDIRAYNPNDPENPNMRIMNSFRIKSKDEQLEILEFLVNYNNENPTSPAWERTVDSMQIEWSAHNIAYNLHFSRSSAQHVDLDLKEEGKGYGYFIWKGIKQLF